MKKKVYDKKIFLCIFTKQLLNKLAYILVGYKRLKCVTKKGKDIKQLLVPYFLKPNTYVGSETSCN